MNWNVKMFGQTLAFTMVGLASSGYASSIVASAKTGQEMGMEACQPTPPAPCYSVDTPPCDYCYGPENVAGNPAVRPYTCDGDFVFTIAGFYWNAHEDGLGFAVENNVKGSPDRAVENHAANSLIHAEISNPNFKWDLGWKLGFGYDMTRDGWDLEVLWTRYNGKAKASAETDTDDNNVLLPLYSDFLPEADLNAHVLEASKIDAHWKLKLNMVDVELGREFWNSKYLTLRPHVGLRFLWIDQNYKLEHRGQSWSNLANDTGLNGFASMSNNFKGAGLRAGFDTEWNFGNGWSLFGNAAYSLVYGRFHVDQREYVREANSGSNMIDILESEDHFHSTKAVTDIALGIQYSTMFNDCKYGFHIGLAWENHIFFNQNQLWRVTRLGASGASTIPNNAGENIFIKGRGDLSTQGWTLTARFEF